MSNIIGDGGSSAYWQNILSGADRSVARSRRFWRQLPGPPRCKICAAPFQGIGGIATRLTTHRKSAANPLVCSACLARLETHPGGADIDVSVLFADIRASAAMADDGSAEAFRDLLQRFYRVTAEVIDDNCGIVDKFLGDGVMALFFPSVAGTDHAGTGACRRPRSLCGREGRTPRRRRRTIGRRPQQRRRLSSARSGGRTSSISPLLGDTVNVAAKLGAAATAGEALISLATWKRIGGRYAKSRLRSVPIPG